MRGRRERSTPRAAGRAPVRGRAAGGAHATTAPPRAPAPPWLPWAGLALLLVGTVVLYVPALHTAFFADDYLFLDQVRGRSLLEALRAPDPLSNFFRPVSRQLYFWVVAGLTHESPVAFRVGNLATLLALLALLFALLRRLAGTRAAMFGTAFLALQYAADIPVRWACGSQELLAVTGALGAMLLHVRGRTRWAGVAMLLAALSKEVVLLTPLVAVVADHRAGERWFTTARRAWPLGAAVLVWGAISLAMPHTRQAASTEVEFDLVKSPLAALGHLLQVVPGLEWVPGRFGAIVAAPPLVPLAAAIAALVLAWRAAPAREPAARRDAPAHALRTGAVWIAAATLPVVAVALLWSAYYYLFAMCGAALVLGVLLARVPVAGAAAALAVLAWGSANARALPEFGLGRDAWTPVSHINAAYLERSNRITDTYLASLQRAYPVLPRGATVYFGGLAANVAFQRGDGPLLRWAYRDTSLRAYYLNAFSDRTARPGPLLFFVAEDDTLREMERGPDLFLRVAFGMLVSDNPAGAEDAFAVAAERMPADARVPYWRAWARLALGDSAGARTLLAAAGLRPVAGASTARPAVLERLAAGDTVAALALANAEAQAHVLDPAAHGLAADLTLIRRRGAPDGTIEAYAARTLAPQDPYGWRRWAMIQADRGRTLEALASFRRYFDLGGPPAAADAEAKQIVATMRAAIPRGAVDPERMPVE